MKKLTLMTGLFCISLMAGLANATGHRAGYDDGVNPPDISLGHGFCIDKQKRICGDVFNVVANVNLKRYCQEAQSLPRLMIFKADYETTVKIRRQKCQN